MEYLLTYGWAILVIAVALGALFELGLFNPYFFTPKAQPGSCSVFRPYGAGTSTDANLVGTCLNELPTLVAVLTPNGRYMSVPYSKTVSIMQTFTVVFWFDPYQCDLFYWPTAIGQGAEYETGGWRIYYGNNQCTSPVNTDLTFAYRATSGSPVWLLFTPNLHLSQWYFVALSYDLPASSASIYAYNSSLKFKATATSSVYPINSIDTPLILDAPNSAYANVQLYNTSLSQTEINSLYDEGIGGAPIDLQHLAGWWPLNGDIKDYSGNGNNGAVTITDFNSNWWNGYSVP